jgi:hypothetical protein
MPDRIEEEAADVVARERDRQAAALRVAGLTYGQIADRLGYANPSGAFKAAERAFTEMADDPTDRIRQLELARLDDMLVGLWVAARGGNVNAIDRVLRIMERRARLLGLDASDGDTGTPTKKGESELERAARKRTERQSRAKA